MASAHGDDEAMWLRYKIECSNNEVSVLVLYANRNTDPLESYDPRSF